VLQLFVSAAVVAVQVSFVLALGALVAVALLYPARAVGTVVPLWFASARPLGFALCAGACLLAVRFSQRAEDGRLARLGVGIATAAAGVLFFTNGLFGFTFPAAMAVTSLAHVTGVRRPGLRFVVTLPFAWALTQVSSPPVPLNGLGLVAGSPGTTMVESYRDNPLKDGYPDCHFKYNSLGYRDLEPPAGGRPPGTTRLLVVGDSYVWGDGIAEGADTIVSRLRGALEAQQPSRWQVLSAAYPGIGTYGYARAVAAMVAAYDVDLVLVGLVGAGADSDPLDAQRAADLLSVAGPIGPLLMQLGVARGLLEGSHALQGQWSSARNEGVSRELMEETWAFCRDRGARLALLDYSWGDPVAAPNGVSVFKLPAKLGYPGARNEYWYEKDVHPKARFNRMIAPMLASWLISLSEGPRSGLRSGQQALD
jgi:hypothetical protein